MSDFIIYDATGRILRTGSAPDDMIEIQAQDGEFLMETTANASTHYVLEGEVTAYTTGELEARSALPQGWVWQMPERLAVDMRAVVDARTQAWERIKKNRAEAESAGFFYNLVLFDSDPISVQRISGAVQLALLAQLAGQAFSIVWTVADNTTMELDAAGMIGVGTALGGHMDQIFTKARTKRDLIEASSDIAFLDGLTWND